MTRKNVCKDGQTEKRQTDGRRRRTTMLRRIDEGEREKKIYAQCFCRLEVRQIITDDGEKKGIDLRASPDER